MKVLFLVASAVLVTGCATATPESERVIVTANNDLVQGCQLIGQSSANQIMIGGGVGAEDVVRRMRNDAAARGATHLLTTQISDTLMTQTSYGRGELYRCG